MVDKCETGASQRPSKNDRSCADSPTFPFEAVTLGAGLGLAGVVTAGEESKEDKFNSDVAGFGRLNDEGGEIGLRMLVDTGGGGRSPTLAGEDVDATNVLRLSGGFSGRSSSSRISRLSDGLIIPFGGGGGGGGNALGNGDGGAGHCPERAAALSTRLRVAR